VVVLEALTVKVVVVVELRVGPVMVEMGGVMEVVVGELEVLPVVFVLLVEFLLTLAAVAAEESDLNHLQ
jgi:hypothetical protein